MSPNHNPPRKLYSNLINTINKAKDSETRNKRNSGKGDSSFSTLHPIIYRCIKSNFIFNILSFSIISTICVRITTISASSLIYTGTCLTLGSSGFFSSSFTIVGTVFSCCCLLRSYDFCCSCICSII